MSERRVTQVVSQASGTYYTTQFREMSAVKFRMFLKDETTYIVAQTSSNTTYFETMGISIGAVFAAITAAVGGGIYLQLVMFAVFTLISLFWVRPFAQRYLHKGEDNRVSNADALLGRQGRVVETVKADGFGRVQIDGDIWKAVTNETQDIPEGSNVRVISRESTVITVESVNCKP